MSTQNELMKLVADYGKECISAGIAELNSNQEVKQRMAEDVRKSHNTLTERLRALLTELEAAREDAARYQWLAAYLVSDRTDWDDQIVFSDTTEVLTATIDDARKGEA